jgi:hypothetical protein
MVSLQLNAEALANGQVAAGSFAGCHQMVAETSNVGSFEHDECQKRRDETCAIA